MTKIEGVARIGQCPLIEQIRMAVMKAKEQDWSYDCFYLHNDTARELTEEAAVLIRGWPGGIGPMELFGYRVEFSRYIQPYEIVFHSAHAALMKRMVL